MKRLLTAAFLLAGGAFAGERYSVTVTAYNPLAAQTDNTPFITATGTRMRAGIVALSRDLLPMIPYGSLIRFVKLQKDPAACHGVLPPGTFRIEDTMHRRKTRQVDIAVMNYTAARTFGRCKGMIEVLRSGKKR